MKNIQYINPDDLNKNPAFSNVIKWNIYIVEGNDPRIAFEVSQKIRGKIENPPAITVVSVSSLAHPDFLIEIDAIAVIPE